MITLVSTVAAFLSALASAHCGDTVSLAAGRYPSVVITSVNPTCPVTITSADPAHPASIATLNVASSSNLIFTGLDFDASASPDPYYAFRISSVHDMTFTKLTVHGTIGADPNGAITGFLVRDSKNVAVTASTFSYLKAAIGQQDNDTVAITGNSFSKLAADAIDNAGSNNVAISGNSATDFVLATDGTHQDFIQFSTYARTKSQQNITISGNTYRRGAGTFVQGIFMNDEVGTLPYLGLTIADNWIEGGNYHGITVYNAVNPVVARNTVQGYTGQQSWLGVVGGSARSSAATRRQTIY